jgi:hypothetical protein
VSFDPRDGENQRLREENARLRHLLAVHGVSIPQAFIRFSKTKPAGFSPWISTRKHGLTILAHFSTRAWQSDVLPNWLTSSGLL